MQNLKHLMSLWRFTVFMFLTPTAETNKFCGCEPRAGRLSHPGCVGQEGCPCSLADKAHWRTSCSGWMENQQMPHASLWAAPRSVRWRPPNRSADPREGLWAPSPAPVWRRSGREEIRTGRQGESPASVPTAELRRRAGNSLRSGPLEAGRSGLWRPIPSGRTVLSAFRRIVFVATPCRLDFKKNLHLKLQEKSKSQRKDLEEVLQGVRSSRMRVYLILGWEALVRCLVKRMGEFEQE